MIWVTGDTHGMNDTAKLGHWTERENMTKQDYVIIAGDFGLIFNCGEVRQALWNDWYDELEFTTLFVDGNHENFDLLNAYPVEIWNGGKIHRITDSVFHLMRGQVFTINGLKFFTMGGAYSIDKPLRRPFVSWWPQEMPSYAECAEALMNLEDHGNEVDYIVTHTAPLSVIRQFYDPLYEKPLNQFLDTVKDTVKFKKWYFGHIHKDVEINEQFRLLYHDIIRIV